MKTKYDYSAVIEHVIGRNILGFLAFLFLVCCGILLTCVIVLVVVGMLGWVGAMFVGAVISVGTITILVKREIKKRGRIYEKH